MEQEVCNEYLRRVCGTECHFQVQVTSYSRKYVDLLKKFAVSADTLLHVSSSHPDLSFLLEIPLCMQNKYLPKFMMGNAVIL